MREGRQRDDRSTIFFVGQHWKTDVASKRKRKQRERNNVVEKRETNERARDSEENARGEGREKQCWSTCSDHGPHVTRRRNRPETNELHFVDNSLSPPKYRLVGPCTRLWWGDPSGPPPHWKSPTNRAFPTTN